MNVFDNIIHDKYRPKQSYPKESNYNSKEEYRAAMAAYNLEASQLEEQFFADLCEQFEIESGSKARLIYYKAYEDGHAWGHSEVASKFCDLVTFVKDLEKII